MSNRIEMSRPLEQLEKQLIQAMSGNSRFDGWGDPLRLTRVLASIKDSFDNPVVPTNGKLVASAVAEFRNTRRILNVTALRYICLGAGELIGQWTLLGDPALWEILRTHAEDGEFRHQIKCFQGLLRTYWSFPVHSVESIGASYRGWLALRGWLHSRLGAIGQLTDQKPVLRTPDWLRVLGNHRNLLTEQPCDRYGHGLLAGDRSELDEAVKGLAIPSGSWVFDEAIYAQIKHVVKQQDPTFHETLPKLLNMVVNPPTVSRLLATRCVASLVSRYAKCSSRPEHIGLRDASIQSIGNPWLRKAAWDAHVLNDYGKPDDHAREMIHGWLRQRLIKDFFELLSEDRAADPRRLNYWLRFEPAIEDMWFVLGNHAYFSTDKDYVDFKERARGRILGLAGQTSPTNNAFIMRIGDYVVIEFGITGNACFVFAWEELQSDLSKKLLSGSQRLHIDIATLRNPDDKLVHRDSPKVRKSWEEKFDEQLIPTLGWRPAASPFSLRSARSRPLDPNRGNLPREMSRPTVVWVPSGMSPVRKEAAPLFSWMDLERHVAKYGLKVADKRRLGGAYWVLIDNTLPEQTNPLRAWGFRYKAGKGWWRE
jgi:EH_Signature domain